MLTAVAKRLGSQFIYSMQVKLRKCFVYIGEVKS